MQANINGRTVKASSPFIIYGIGEGVLNEFNSFDCAISFCENHRESHRIDEGCDTDAKVYAWHNGQWQDAEAVGF